MAKIVLAGRSDCPYYARCELLGDRLAKNLQNFKLHKIVVQPEDWEKWLSDTCRERGWNFSKSPIIWRELIERGGKGVLIGDANDFQEYIKAYYDRMSEMTTSDMLAIAEENKEVKNRDDQEVAAYKALSQPVYVCMTNASSSICYHLLNSLGTGQILDPNTEISFRLLVSSEKDAELARASAMEAEDLAHGYVASINVCTDPYEAFKDCSIIIFLDSIPRAPRESLKQWLDRNAELFQSYAVVINSQALRTCKILVCGKGPLNFIAMILAKSVTSIVTDNIVAISTVVENHAKSVIGEKLHVNPAGVVNLIVWGCINETRFYDLTQCRVFGHRSAITGPPWHSVMCTAAIKNSKWIDQDFPAHVAAREQKLTAAMGYASGLSKASAITQILNYWHNCSPENEIISLGVRSEGWYKVPEGLYFSFPIRMESKGHWHVVTDMNITPEIKKAIRDCVKDIKSQWRIHTGEPESPDLYSSTTIPSGSYVTSAGEEEDVPEDLKSPTPERTEE